jgi:hypothetical protein
VRITTNLVQVDAVVTDRNGNLVSDLKPDEVRIFEDDKQQKVTQVCTKLDGAVGREAGEVGWVV